MAVDGSEQLIRTSAVEARVVQQLMDDSRSQRQVLILDSCFSGAIEPGMRRGANRGAPQEVDVAAALGGEGRAILTAASATQHAYETEKGGTYTRFLVEGIETGAADRDEDGRITVDELHRYACEKLQEVSPAIEPKLYAVETGYRIIVTNAPLGDPKLRYRKEVEQLAKQREGKLSAIVLAGLEVRGEQLGLAMDIVEEIHNDVLRPYREFEQKLQRYERIFTRAIQAENPLSWATQEDLKYLQRVLGLTAENIAPIQQQFTNSSTNALEPGITCGSESLEDLSDKSLSSEDFFTQGWEKQNKGDLKGAIADYDQAIRLKSDDAAAYYKRGNARFKVGDKEKAIADYDQAIKLNPGYSDAYYNRGNVRFKVGDKEEAVADYNQVIQFQPDCAHAYYNRGLARSALGDKQGAIADYDQAIKLKPDYAKAHNNRGNARSALGDKQGAIADFKKAIELYRQQGDTEWLQKASERLEEIQK
jgi:tetratricopeptide (TPR) repeat protein